ncbi:DnaJ domain-containing protein [Cephalotus follicularis]|uniref:DnaJ domain-containing protein n=1 Tax=Cephalotus follicularis TaxID=3775 RepID=A0A1Q3ALX6_CEPFO|nr:DnaJ domain-containing protein [Cephalotus follicularis]
MASSTSSSPLVTTSHLFGQKLVTKAPLSTPTCVRFRPLRISAAATCTSARPDIASPPATSSSSLYQVLGIQKGATCQEIKAAYRRLARVLHPDVATNSQKDNAGFDFIRIHEAYATLSDPQKRADYDRMFFRQMKPVGYPFATSASASRFSGYKGRTWETDQCW